MQPKRTIPPDLLGSDTFNDRFWEKVDVGEDIDCWPFIGSRNQHGYGRFAISKGQWQYAHRVAWALEHTRNVPEGLRVLHYCDIPPCCNPTHLFLGTQSDNMQDRATKGRDNAPRGEAHAAAKLTEQDVQQIRDRWRRGERNAKRIGAEYGITGTSVARIVTHKGWTHVP